MTAASIVGGANLARRFAAWRVPNESPTRTSRRPDSRDLPRRHHRPAHRGAMFEDAERVTVPFRSSPKCSRSRTWTAPENIRTYATFSPRAFRSTLKTAPAGAASSARAATGRNVVIPVMSSAMPSPVTAEPMYTGWALPAAVFVREVGGELPLEVLGDERVRGEPIANRIEHALGIGTRAVDLVDEEQRRHPQSLQRAHQHDRLGLHALDGRQHQHGGVEDDQRALDLGDEVGVTRACR